MALLFLMRHAKAVTAEPGMADFSRPLAPRGKTDAARMGEALAQSFPRPAQVLCSSAERTRQTPGNLGLAFTDENTRFSRTLFDAESGEGYLPEIRAVRDWSGLLVIGHNPAIMEAALLLTGDGEREARDRLAAGFPTASVAVLEIGEEVSPRSGTLRAFLSPSAL